MQYDKTNILQPSQEYESTAEIQGYYSQNNPLAYNPSQYDETQIYHHQNQYCQQQQGQGYPYDNHQIASHLASSNNYLNNNQQIEWCNAQQQNNSWGIDNVSGNEYELGYCEQLSESISQDKRGQISLGQMAEPYHQQNMQEHPNNLSQQIYLSQSQFQENQVKEDQQISNVSQKSVQYQEGKKEKRKRKITKVKHNLDGKPVDKLKNFYRNFMGRVEKALVPMYKNNKDMIQLIKRLCNQSNLRNFLVLFPQMKQEANEENKNFNENGEDEDDEDDYQSQNDKPHDSQLLEELREKVNVIFGQNFHKMVCLYKSNNSFKNKEEFFYGCHFYAERQAQKQPLLYSKIFPAKANQVFAFNFEKTIFPEAQFLSQSQGISPYPEQNVQQYYYPSMSPQCSQQPDSPALFHNF